MPTRTGPQPVVFSTSRDDALTSAAAHAAEGGTAPPPGEGGSPRVVIRGETPRANASAFIDWLSVTLPFELNGPPLDWAQSLPTILGVRDLVIGQQENGTAGFLHSAPLIIRRAATAVKVGKLAWGGESQRNRVYLSISGALCARITDWESVASHLYQLSARITRVDLAHDDVEGVRGVELAESMYDAGAFQSGGRNPICSYQGDWKQVSGLGRSFYVGKRGHGKLLRVYEKGKQLGDATSPWVRWEVELGNRDRVIPLAVVTEPAPYMAGAFPALAFISAESVRIPTQRKVLQTSLQHLIACLGDSYGKTINAMLMQGYDPADIVAVVQRSGIPRRLHRPMAGLAKGSRLYGDGRGEP